MFLLNSRSHRFSAAPLGSGRKSLHLPEAHLLPKLRCQFAEFLLPSSLKRLSIFIPPTCVGLRYGPNGLKLRGFSWKQGIRDFREQSSSSFPRLALSPPDLPKDHVYTLQPGRPTPGRHNLLRPPIAPVGGSGILTRFPSATALALTLGADSPCADERGAGNLGLSATGLSPCFIATHVSIRTSDTSSSPLEPPSQSLRNAPLHQPAISAAHPAPQDLRTFRAYEIRSFGSRLEPRYIFRAGRLDQ